MNEVSTVQALGGQFEATFRRHGIPFELVDEFPIDSIIRVPAVQVRSKHIAPARRVTRYEEQMRAGAVFPPLVIRKHDKALLDGNTRMAAYNRLKRAAATVYVVDPRNDVQAIILAGALNQLGGADLDPEEARDVALKMHKQGAVVASIAKELGISSSRITRWANAEQGRHHAEALGLESKYLDLSQNSQEALAKVSRDRVFIELLEAVSSKKPKVLELKDLVKRVNAAGSDDEAVEDVRRTAMAWPEADGGTAKVPAMAAESRLKALVAEDPTYWVDRAHGERLLPLWRQVLSTASAVVAQYES